jgi:hypothetical protein
MTHAMNMVPMLSYCHKNNLLTGALAPFITLLVGAMIALFIAMVGVLVVFGGFGGMINAFRGASMSQALSRVIGVLGVAIAVPVILVLAGAIVPKLFTMC